LKPTSLEQSLIWHASVDLGALSRQRVLFLIDRPTNRIAFVALWNGENDRIQKYGMRVIRRSATTALCIGKPLSAARDHTPSRLEAEVSIAGGHPGEKRTSFFLSASILDGQLQLPADCSAFRRQRAVVKIELPAGGSQEATS
jgi:hypothetical protein